MVSGPTRMDDLRQSLAARSTSTLVATPAALIMMLCGGAFASHAGADSLDTAGSKVLSQWSAAFDRGAFVTADGVALLKSACSPLGARHRQGH